MRAFLYLCIFALCGCASSGTKGFDQAAYNERLAANLATCGQIAPPYEAYMNCRGAAELSAARASGASSTLLLAEAAYARDRTAVAARVDRGELSPQEGIQQVRFLREEHLTRLAVADEAKKMRSREQLNQTINQWQAYQQRQAEIDAINRANRPALPTRTSCRTSFGVTNCSTF